MIWQGPGLRQIGMIVIGPVQIRGFPNWQAGRDRSDQGRVSAACTRPVVAFQTLSLPRRGIPTPGCLIAVPCYLELSCQRMLWTSLVGYSPPAVSIRLADTRQLRNRGKEAHITGKSGGRERRSRQYSLCMRILAHMKHTQTNKTHTHIHTQRRTYTNHVKH